MSDWRGTFSPDYIAEMEASQEVLDLYKAQRDPLGLTEEQRLASTVAAYVDDLRSGRICDRNVQAVTDLPPGSLIQVFGVTYTREQFLQLI